MFSWMWLRFLSSCLSFWAWLLQGFWHSYLWFPIRSNLFRAPLPCDLHLSIFSSSPPAIECHVRKARNEHSRPWGCWRWFRLGSNPGCASFPALPTSDRRTSSARVKCTRESLSTVVPRRSKRHISHVLYLYGVLWCLMLMWCAIVRFAMLRYEVVWCGMLSHAVVCSGGLWCPTAWYGMHGCMYAWMPVWMYVLCIYGCMDACMNVWSLHHSVAR